jgi:glycerol-3-phosphate acyltransferase PlsY
MTIQALLVMLLGYLLGSIPTAVLVSRAITGRDVRELGDGNMGARNTFMSLGWRAGIFVFLADVAKGGLAVWLAQYAGLSEGLVLLAGGCAIVGHSFPILAGFRGGQGMATIVGVFGMLFPVPTLVGFCVFGVTLLLTRTWDLACGLGFLVLVVLLWILGAPLSLRLYPFIVLPTIALRKLMQGRFAREVTA